MSEKKDTAIGIAKISMGMTFFGLPFSLFVSGLFDLTGNYFLIFVLYTVLAVVCAVLTWLIFSQKKKEK